MATKTATIAIVESELPGMQAYAARHGWRITWRPDDLIILAEGKHPADCSPACLHADVTGYRAQPPAWRWTTGNPDHKPVVAQPGALPGGISSMFHDNGTICAPFNRLAYKENNGPHENWGGPSAWLDVRATVSATRL